MIKVAIITESVETGRGGAERSVLELAEALQGQGADVTILGAKGKDQIPGVVFVCGEAAGRRVRLPVFEEAIRRHLSNHHYDIIHSMLPFLFADVYGPRGGSYKEAMLGNIASCRSNLVRTCKRFTHRMNLRRSRLLAAEKRLCQAGNKTIIVALSDSVKAHFLKHYKIDNRRVVVVPNAIDTSILTTTDKQQVQKLRQDILRRAGLADPADLVGWAGGENGGQANRRARESSIKDTGQETQGQGAVIFLFAANNFRLKGLRSLIEALAIVIRESGNDRIILAAAGGGKQPPYRRLACRLGVEKNIVFLGSTDGIETAIVACDVATLPTYYDPCSRFILEALAAGKPVITTKYNGAAERYANARHGFIINSPDDIEDIAEAIRFLAEADNRKAAKEAIIADDLKEKVSIKNHAKKLMEIYNSKRNQ